LGSSGHKQTPKWSSAISSYKAGADSGVSLYLSVFFVIFVTNAYQNAAKMSIRAKLQWERLEAVLGLSLAEEVSEVRSFF